LLHDGVRPVFVLTAIIRFYGSRDKGDDILMEVWPDSEGVGCRFGREACDDTVFLINTALQVVREVSQCRDCGLDLGSGGSATCGVVRALDARVLERASAHERAARGELARLPAGSRQNHCVRVWRLVGLCQLRWPKKLCGQRPVRHVDDAHCSWCGDFASFALLGDVMNCGAFRCASVAPHVARIPLPRLQCCSDKD
jgi:hypothetical protein